MRRYLTILLLITIAKVSMAQALDPTFNGTGMITGTATIDGINHFDSPVDIIYDHNTGNIVMLNQLNNMGGLLHRYTPDGEIDLTYGEDGLSFFAVGGIENRVLNLFEKEDGYDIGGFISQEEDHYSPFLLKTNFDGTVKTDFGIDGINAVYDIEYLISYLASEGPSGRTAFVGWNYEVVFGDPGAGLMRFNADGTYDSVFGYTPFGIEGHTEFSTTLELADGRQLAAGFTYNPTHDTSLSFLAVFDDNGELDPDFGDAGILIPDPTIDFRNFNFKHLEQDAAGNLYVSGYLATPDDYVMVIFKFDTDGNAIAEFGDQGFVYLSNNYFIEPRGMVVTPEFEVYALGVDHLIDDATLHTNIFKLKADGTVDASFTNGSPGKFRIEIEATDDDVSGYQIIMQPDGKLLVTGRVEGLTANTDHFLCRIDPDYSVGISSLPKINPLEISPNPVTNVFEIKSEVTIENVSIIDCNGREYMNMSINNISGSFNVESLPAGLYFMRAIYSDGNSASRSFIKI